MLSGQRVEVVLAPRFTSYVGGGAFPTLPIPISAYEGLVLSSWRGALVGTVPTLLVAMFESNDLINWTSATGTILTPGANQEVQSVVTFTKAWFRMDVILAPADAGVTMWAQGFFILREK